MAEEEGVHEIDLDVEPDTIEGYKEHLEFAKVFSNFILHISAFTLSFIY
jgi:hypothetical protein